MLLSQREGTLPFVVGYENHPLTFRLLEEEVTEVREPQTYGHM